MAVLQRHNLLRAAPVRDATQIRRFRPIIGEADVEELLKATIDTAVSSKAIRPAEFERVTVDTTVQEKAIAHPVDSRLLEIARRKVVAIARRAGIARSRPSSKKLGQDAAAQSGWLRPRQAVQAPPQGAQAPAHDLGHCAARGAAQDRLGPP